MYGPFIYKSLRAVDTFAESINRGNTGKILHSDNSIVGFGMHVWNKYKRSKSR